MKSDLSKLPNIGKDTEKRLIETGITSISELIEAGTENVFLRLQVLDPGACIQLLYGLEGAVQGISATKLTNERKLELLEFHQLSQKK